MRDIDVLDYLPDLDPTLEATYRFYHDIRQVIKDKNIELLKEYLKQPSPLISDYMKTSVKTLNKYLGYLENTLTYGFTNGGIEEINNKIKVIKRIAFGYKSFFHFRNRIFITQNLTQLKTA